MPKILFVCTKNIFRSPIAEYFLKNELAKSVSTNQWNIESAGTWANEGERVLTTIEINSKKLGLSGIEKHRSRRLNFSILETSDLVITMTEDQKEAIASEFPVFKKNIFQLSYIAKKFNYDIPDLDIINNNTLPIAKEIGMLIKSGCEKILFEADARSMYKNYVQKK